MATPDEKITKGEAAIRAAISHKLKELARQIKAPSSDASEEEWQEYWQKRTEAIPLVENPKLEDGETKEYRVHCGECLQYYRLFANVETGAVAVVDQDKVSCPHCGAASSHWIQLATHLAGWFNSAFTR